MVFNQFKMVVMFFKTASNFPNFDHTNDIFPNSTGPDFRKVGKSQSWVVYTK